MERQHGPQADPQAPAGEPPTSAIDEPGPRAQPPGDGIARNTAFALLVQLTGALFTAGLVLFLARRLDPTGYGTFALATSIGALLLLPSDFGISAAAARFVAERRGDRAAVGRVLADALVLKLAVAGAVSAAMFLCSGPIADAYGQPALTWPLRGIALALFGQSLMLLFAGSFVAQRRIAANLRIALSESAVEAVATVALVLGGAGATGAAFGRAIGYGFAAGAGLALSVRLVGRSVVAVAGISARSVRRVLAYAGVLAVVDSAWSAFTVIDVLLIGVFLDTASVGFFQGPMRLTTLLHYPGLAVASAVAPTLVRVENRAPNVDAFVRAIHYLLILQTALIVPVLVWPRPIVELLLGPSYHESAIVLQVLAGYIFLIGLAPLVSLTTNYLGVARRRLPIALAALLINLVLDAVLIPRIGIVGGAIGTDIGLAVYVGGHFWICKRLLAVPLRPIAGTLARSAPAALAMAGVLLAAGRTQLSLGEWLAGAVGGASVFAIMLVVFGGVSPAELRAVFGAVGRRFRDLPTRA